MTSVFLNLMALAIDWGRPYQFLDQELAQVVQDAELGKRIADRLVHVSTHHLGDQWVYIHIEVQREGSGKQGFEERLLIYNYRFFDRYHRPVATLAVLADEAPHWRPDRYGYELFGCRHLLEFPTVKLLDYASRLEALLSDRNPFALVTAAHLLTQQTKGGDQARYAAKWRLAKLLYERDWAKQRIIDLFAVIDWLLRLPVELERRLWSSITELERNANVPYTLSKRWNSARHPARNSQGRGGPIAQAADPAIRKPYARRRKPNPEGRHRTTGSLGMNPDKCLAFRTKGFTVRRFCWTVNSRETY